MLALRLTEGPNGGGARLRGGWVGEAYKGMRTGTKGHCAKGKVTNKQADEADECANEPEGNTDCGV